MPRVLFLPHAARTGYFQQLLEMAKTRADWRIATIASELSRSQARSYIANEDAFYTLPNIGDLAQKAGEPSTELSDYIARCEAASGIPVNRIILANERDLGGAFNLKAYTYAQRGYAKRMLRENRLPQRVIAAFFRRILDIIDDFRPDFVLAGNVSAAQNFVCALVAAERGIPFITGRNSKILSDRVYWTGELRMFNEPGERRCAELIKQNQTPSREASAFIEEFRGKPRTVAYIAENWKRGEQGNLLKSHIYFAELALAHIAHRVKNKPGQPPKALFAHIADYYRWIWLKHRSTNLYDTFTPEQLTETSYVYLPLHKEPELALNFQAPFWHDQLNLIACLSAALPMNTRLLVREHKFNHGRRPGDYLKQIKALPDVRLVHPFDPQFKYIQHADLVITDNGSSGWEALLFQRPLLTLAHTFYGATGLARHFDDTDRLGAYLVEAIRKTPQVADDHDTRLALLVDAERETTFPNDTEGAEQSIGWIEQMAKAAPALETA